MTTPSPASVRSTSPLPAAALAKGLGLGLIALAALLVCTPLLQRLAPTELWPALLLLFVLYPLAALLLGVASRLAGVPLWPLILVTPAVFLVIVAVWYNETALVYVPAYTLLSLAGYALARMLAASRRRAAPAHNRV